MCPTVWLNFVAMRRDEADHGDRRARMRRMPVCPGRRGHGSASFMTEPPMTDFDIIIKGGTIVDGTRTPRYVSDLAIKNGKIAQIGGLKGKTADRVLDAAGRIVAPGFVDLHTHYDAQIFWDPYCTLSGWHGVTSVALGNCGFGFAPSRTEDRDRAMLSMTRNEAIPYEAMKAGMPWDWVTFPDFIESLSRTPKGVNCLTYVPLTPLYAWVMGWEEAKKRRPTEEELREMCRLIHEAMDAGPRKNSRKCAGGCSGRWMPGRGRTPGNVPVDPRGDGCRGVWLVCPCLGYKFHSTRL